MTRCPEPVGPNEIAHMLNVTRQRVTQLRQSKEFPLAWRVLATGSVWRDTEVEEYARKNGRDVRPAFDD